MWRFLTRFAGLERTNDQIIVVSLALLCLGSTTAFSQHQWERQNRQLHRHSFMYDVDLRDSTHAVVAAGESLMLTDDGGNNWRESTDTLLSNIWDIRYLSDSILVGYCAAGIVRSNDAGRSWTLVLDTTLGVVRMRALKSGPCFLAYHRSFNSDSMCAMVSTDSGLTWHRYSKSAVGPAVDIHFFNLDTALAMASSGLVSRTFDHGEHWIQLGAGIPGTAITSFAFADLSTGVAIDQFSQRVFRTADSGAHWSLVYTSSYGSLNDVRFLDSLTVIVVGNAGQLLRSTDRGKTFAPVFTQTASRLWTISKSKKKTMYAIGDGGTILRTDDGGSSWSNQSEVFENLSSTVMLDSLTAFAAGAGGLIMSTADAGRRWRRVFTGVAVGLRSIAFGRRDRGVAVGDSGALLVTTDSGLHWTAQPTGVRSSLNAVAFATPYRGVAVGDGGTVLRTTDGGGTWMKSVIDARRSLKKIAVVDSTTWMAISISGLFRSTDGGEQWTTAKESGNSWKDIAFCTDSIGVLIGDAPFGADPGHVCLRTTDGGVTWLLTDSSGVLSPSSLLSFRRGTLRGVGNAGARTTDGGLTWFGAEEMEDVKALACLDGNNALAVGDDGVVYRTFNGGGRILARPIVTPSPLDFGNVPVFKYATDSIAIRNVDHDTLYIGENASCFGIRVPPGETRYSRVMEYANKTSKLSGTLRFMSNADMSQVAIPWTLTGVGAIASYNSHGVEFDSVVLGAPVTRPFVISNTGNAALHISGIRTNDQRITPLPESTAVAPQDSLALQLTFDGTPGSQYAKLYFTNDGASAWHNGASVVHLDSTGIWIHVASAVGEESLGPNAMALDPIAPNPVASITTFGFVLPRDATIDLSVVGLDGRLCAHVASERLPAGHHSLRWNAAELPNGTYVLRLRVGGSELTKLLVVHR